MQALSVRDAQALLEAGRGDEFEALYVLAITTGMRLGELLGLTWQDIDLDRRRLSVQRSLVRLKGRWIAGEPKSERSRRTVALSARAVAALREHRRRQIADGRHAQMSYDLGDLVFTHESGKPVLGGHVTERCLKPLLRRAGLPIIRFHDPRHTAATLPLTQGVHPKLVAEMLGHSSVQLTLDLYSHVLPDLQDRVARAMDEALPIPDWEPAPAPGP
jgi:integrase